MKSIVPICSEWVIRASRASLQARLHVLFREGIAGWARCAAPVRTSGAVTPADLARKPEYLRKTTVFAPLSPDERLLLERTTMVRNDHGWVLDGPNDAGKVVRIPKCGRVVLSRMTVDGCKLMKSLSL